MKVLLLGAGVQSSTIMLMGIVGAFDRPDYAIFADTGWEPKAVYAHLAWLEAQAEGMTIYRVSAGNIRAEVLASVDRERYASARIPRLPFFTTPEGNGGKRGMLRRTCTNNYKIEPIDRKIRELLGLKKRQRIPKGITIEKWFGISLDEAHRMRTPDAQYIVHRYPLIDLRMRRGDCVAWLTQHGYAIPPKSACVGCFAYETEVITSTGAKPLGSLVSANGVGRAELLIPRPRSGWASWREVDVRSFGKQRLWKLSLARGRSTKILYTTAEHRWKTRDRKTACWSDFVTTLDLQPGDVLPIARTQPPWNGQHKAIPSPFGIAAGFTFGDGERSNRRWRPASVNFYEGKDEPMLRYFPICKVANYVGTHGERFKRIGGLPRAWKDLPPLTESRGYLLGWLSGYFAADGTVSGEGQATLFSARREHISAVRDLCYVLGVRTSPVLKKIHPAKGGLATIYSVTLNARDLPESFWLMPHHAERMAHRLDETAIREGGWAVVSIEASDREEEVFCAIVPGEEMFVLTDNLVTGNCPFHSDAMWRDLKRSSPAEWADAVAFDAAIRHMPGLVGAAYLHGSLVPLSDVDLRSDDERGQPDLFGNECHGLCGV